MAARVELRGGKLTVVFSNGKSRSTNITVAKEDTVAQITAKVRNAIDVGIAYAPNDDEADNVERIRAASTAAGIHRRLHPRTETQGERRQPQPRRQRRRRKEEEPDIVEIPEPPPTPRPTITMEWIQMQLRDSGRREKTAQGAISSLHTNTRYVNQFIAPNATRKERRTAVQRQATMTVFNALYQIPSFRLYLSSQATVRPEFLALQDYVTGRDEDTGLAPDADAEIIQAADYYIRHYLVNFVARPNGGNERYRQEIEQAPGVMWMVTRSHEVRESGSDKDKEATRFHFRRMYLSGPMDASTITMAALYLRRWHQENPEKGKGKPQEKIAVWQAPLILEIPSEKAAVPAPKVAASAEPSNIDAIMKRPDITILGASISAGGAIERELERLTRKHASKSRATTQAKVSRSTVVMRREFDRLELGKRGKGGNILILSGWASVNDGFGSMDKIKENYEYMITRARKAGKMVVVFGVGPYAGSYVGLKKTERQKAQARADELNRWLRERSDIVYVDISALGEGSPAKLRRQFERTDKPDGLHPNTRGRNEIARRIYQAAFRHHYEETGEKAKEPEPQRNALEEHAHRNWRTLDRELNMAMRNGRPQSVVTIIRAIPPEARKLVTVGGSQMNILERALMQLKRTDMNKAFDSFFNTILHDKSTPLGKEFMAWCESRKEFRGVARGSVRLSENSSARDRRVVMRAVQTYLNYVAGKSGAVEEKYGKDLEILMQQVFKASGKRVDVNGRCDPQTIAALALYAWRRRNKGARPGQWAKGLTGVTVEQPAQPAPAERRPEPEKGGRRRVLQL
jgi:hypothetical protein